MKRLKGLTDPDAPAHVAHAFGLPMAAIYTHDLDEWVRLLDRVERFLAQASEATCADYARFVAERYGPCDGPSLDDLSWMLSAMAVRMHTLINNAMPS
jgi:hypothetical protein